MGLVKTGISAVGKLLVVTALAGTFLVGMLSVFYLSLKGEEVEIPKIVGKNFNNGEDELTKLGLRIKKVATRYSNEKPNTILEQRPRAGENAKTGLMVFVVVSQENPDGNEAPIDIEDKEKEVKEEKNEIEALPELETDKSKKKSKKTNKKTGSKTRDVIKKTKKEKEDKDKKESKDTATTTDSKTGTDNKATNPKGTEPKTSGDKPKTPQNQKPKTNTTKPENKKPANPTKKPNTAGDTRNRKVPPSN